MLLLAAACQSIHPTGHSDQDFVIDENSDNLIVLAGQPEGNVVVLAASRELAKGVEKITGKKIQTATSASPERIKHGGLIFVGESPLTKRLGVDLSDPVFDGGESAFRLTVQDRNLFLMGADDALPVIRDDGRRGTLYATYEFLEKFGGARWFWPGATGEYIPRKKRIRIPVSDIVSTPFFPIREIRTTRRGEEADVFWIWANRNRLVSDWRCGLGHSWRKHVDGNSMFEGHPEWYSMYRGMGDEPVRQPLTNNCKAGQLCVTNPDLLDHFANELEKKAAMKNGVNIVQSISPNDGFRFCVCPNCRSLDVPGKAQYTKNGAQGDISNRMWTFANEIGTRLKKRGVKSKVGMYAYTFCRNPPERIDRIEDNVVVAYALPLQGAPPATREKLYGKLKEWRAKTKNLLYRGYWYGYTPRTRNLGDDIDFFKELGMLGCSSEYSRNFALKAPTYYLATRLLWDPDIDADEELDEFYALAFGESAPHIRRYFDILEKAGENLNDSGLYHPRNMHLLLSAFTPELFRKLKWELDEARRVATRKDAAARVEWVGTGWDYMKVFIDYLRGLTNLKSSGFGFGYLKDFPAGEAISGPEELKKEIARVYDLSLKKREMIKKHDLDFCFMSNDMYNFIETCRSGWDRDIKRMHEDFVLAETPSFPIPVEWKFWKDEEKQGENLGVHLDSYNDDAWENIRTNDTWEKQGHPYDGVAWYRRRVFIPKKKDYPIVKLFIGASDESTWVYVNGRPCGENVFGPDNQDSWLKPFEVDITKFVRFDAANLLTLKVRDLRGAGGVYKPCVIRYGRSPSETGGIDLLDGVGDFEKGLSEWELKPNDRAEIILKNDVPLVGDKSLVVKCKPGEHPASICNRFQTTANSRLQLSLAYKISNLVTDPGGRNPLTIAARINFIVNGDVEPEYRKWLKLSEKNPGEDAGEGWRRACRFVKSPPSDAQARLSIFFYRSGTYYLDDVKVLELK